VSVNSQEAAYKKFLLGDLHTAGDYKIIIRSPWHNSLKNAKNSEFLSKGLSYRLRLLPYTDNLFTVKITRKQSILYDIPMDFVVDTATSTTGKEPWYEFESMSQVAQNKSIIEKQAKAQNVDPDLVKAIVYMESTHGYYDKLVEPFDANTSILPMNIRSDYWKDLGYSREELKKVESNIEAGVLLIKRISLRARPKTIEVIASLYNHLGATKVNEYGSRVTKIHKEKLWIPKPETPGVVDQIRSEVDRYESMSPIEQYNFLRRLFGA
jgi:hypothetical protein